MKTQISLSLISSMVVLQFFCFMITIQGQKAELVVQTGHSTVVESVAFSPDGKILASGSWDNTIKLWNVETGKELRTFTTHTNRIRSITFSPDGETLASGSDDTTIKLWDIKTGKELRTFTGHSSWVKSVAFSPDGKILASVSDDNTIRLWDIKTGKELRTFTNYFSYFSSLAISPDGKLLASGSSDSTIEIWDIKTGKKLRTITGHADEVRSVTFSQDGSFLASGSADKTVKLWDVKSGRQLGNFVGHSAVIWSVTFSPDGKTLASASDDKTIRIWNIKTGKELQNLAKHTDAVYSVKFSLDGKTLASGSRDSTIKLWNTETGQQLRTLAGHAMSGPVAFSRDGKTLANGSYNSIKLWDTGNGKGFRMLTGHASDVISLSFNSDGKTLASGGGNGDIKLWDTETGKELRTLSGHSEAVQSLSFSSNGEFIASGSGDKTIKIWNVKTGKLLQTFTGHSDSVMSVEFSKDGKILASGSFDKTIKIWNIKTATVRQTFTGNPDSIWSVKFGKDEKTLASGGDKLIKIWNVEKGEEIESLDTYSDEAKRKMAKLFPTLYEEAVSEKLITEKNPNGKIKLFDRRTGKELITLIALDEKDWAVVTPDGRFDTSKNLDSVEGIHWILSDRPLIPVPLEIFMRQYYEPNLLQRIIKCTEENNYNKEFKSLPSIADINRVQPKISIKNIKSSDKVANLVDITVEVENKAEDINLSSTDKTQKKQFFSGAFDLRLFHNGQLVGVSTPKDKLNQFIHEAPRLVAENKVSQKLINTPEDAAWRETNDIFKLKTDNVKFISSTKAIYTFHNIKLPQDGRKAVEFTAYAFNSDRVKSETTESVKFSIPDEISNSPKKGRAYLISIGVNASENPAYDLHYAANDARKMQEIVGSRLKVDSSKYSEAVQIPLISDYDENGKLTENTAQKAIIKGVFSLLSGNQNEVSPDIIKQIPNHEQIKAVEPEDTLIVTYSGHGYTDQSGIFYMLPYDIGKNTTTLTPQILQKMISSDELSLWMQDITASEMIMIIDACHSSAAVQGAGFKPGPMGSRGLGQLAYDKDMKILSATQADNVALELKNLQHGLLTYALLEDGINRSLADTDKDKQMLSTEWLAYAEARVPELYDEVRNKKRNILIDGKMVTGEKGVELAGLNAKNSGIQRPALFDFKRRNIKNTLFYLP